MKVSQVLPILASRSQRPLPGLPETDVFVVDLGFLNETEAISERRSCGIRLLTNITDA